MKSSLFSVASASIALALSSYCSASVIDSVTVGGGLGTELTSISVDGTAYAVGDLVPVSQLLAYKPATQSVLLLNIGSPDPAQGTRHTVIDGDDNLATGIVNLFTSNDAAQLQFAAPVLNQPGADLVLFEAGGTDVYAIQTKSGGTFTVSSGGFIAIPTKPSSFLNLRNTGTTPVADLAAVENWASLFSNGGTFNFAIHAVLVDLSDLGYAEGESISVLKLGSGTGTGVDLMAAYGLVPEPATVSLLVVGGMMLSSRRSR